MNRTNGQCKKKYNSNPNCKPCGVVQDDELVKRLEGLYNSIHLYLMFFYQDLKDGKLTEINKERHLSDTESYIIKFFKEVDYDSIFAREQEKRFSEIRCLKNENRELKKMLGEKGSNKFSREKMDNSSQTVSQWLNLEPGLGWFYLEQRRIYLNFSRDIIFGVDKDGEFAKRLEELYSSINFYLTCFCEKLKEGRLTERMKQRYLSLAESCIIEFFKEVDYDSIFTKEQEKRLSEIRSLKNENRELKKMLGEKGSNKDFRKKRFFLQSVREWRNIKGRTSTIELEKLVPNLISITFGKKNFRTTHSLPIKAAMKLRDELSLQLNTL